MGYWSLNDGSIGRTFEYVVLQESSAPRADEHAIWDTFAIPQAWFSTGDAKPVRDLMRDLEWVNRGEP